jgi:hypothetical protein
LRIERRPPAFLRAALDGSIKRTQVQPPNQCPLGRGVTDLDKQTIAAQTALAETTS